jgi:hypothetical protein
MDRSLRYQQEVKTTPRGDRGEYCEAAGVVARQSDDTVSRLSRSRISFPVLKKATAFSPTETIAPVRGLRP